MTITPERLAEIRVMFAEVAAMNGPAEETASWRYEAWELLAALDEVTAERDALEGECEMRRHLAKRDAAMAALAEAEAERDVALVKMHEARSAAEDARAALAQQDEEVAAHEYEQTKAMAAVIRERDALRGELHEVLAERDAALASAKDAAWVVGSIASAAWGGGVPGPGQNVPTCREVIDRVAALRAERDASLAALAKLRTAAEGAAIALTADEAPEEFDEWDAFQASGAATLQAALTATADIATAGEMVLAEAREYGAEAMRAACEGRLRSMIEHEAGFASTVVGLRIAAVEISTMGDLTTRRAAIREQRERGGR